MTDRRHRPSERVPDRVGIVAGRRPAVWAVLLVLAGAAPGQAQTGAFTFRGFADVGLTDFAAQNSFEAVLGSNRGFVFGGGGELLWSQRVFVQARASRVRRTGQRVFIHDGDRFDLGIPVTVTVTPVELVGGYRFRLHPRLIPYAGAGAGWHRYEESSAHADAAENVADRFVGLHLLAGAEVRMTRWFGAAVETAWAAVPGALGRDPNGVSERFQETDLGGLTLRAKLTVGR